MVQAERKADSAAQFSGVLLRLNDCETAQTGPNSFGYAFAGISLRVRQQFLRNFDGDFAHFAHVGSMPAAALVFKLVNAPWSG